VLWKYLSMNFVLQTQKKAANCGFFHCTEKAPVSECRFHVNMMPFTKVLVTYFLTVPFYNKAIGHSRTSYRDIHFRNVFQTLSMLCHVFLSLV
jgi:hypothetical protein